MDIPWDWQWTNICFFLTCSTLRLTPLSQCFLVYWPVQHIHYNDALYEYTVSLIYPCACHSACRIIKLWWNNGRAQGEVEEASHAKAKLDLPPQNITLIQLITEQTRAFLTPLLTCVSLLAAHTHTHTSLIDAWVSPLVLSVSSLSVLPWRKFAPFRHRYCFSINVAPAFKTPSNLVPFPRYQSNYPVLAIYIPCHTVRHQLVTEPPH